MGLTSPTADITSTAGTHLIIMDDEDGLRSDIAVTDAILVDGRERGTGALHQASANSSTASRLSCTRQTVYHSHRRIQLQIKRFGCLVQRRCCDFRGSATLQST